MTGKPKYGIVIGIKTEECEGFTTYNFEVADLHNYYVGENGVCVHNAGGCGGSQPGEYLAKKAPQQVTPGTKVLRGQDISKLGKVRPWEAYYDDFGRMIARTDFAGNLAQGIPNPHYHLYQYGPGLSPNGFEFGKHIGGIFTP